MKRLKFLMVIRTTLLITIAILVGVYLGNLTISLIQDTQEVEGE